MKRIVVSFALICVVLCLFACDKSEAVDENAYNENYEYDGTSLVGKWREEGYIDDQYQIYEFGSDGRVSCTLYSFGIEIGRLEATYSIEGSNTLVINWNENQVDKNNFSISKNNVLVITQIASASTQEMRFVPYDLKYNISNEELCGSWRSNSSTGEIFTFYEDYTGRVSGLGEAYDFLYSTNESTIFMSFDFVGGSQHTEGLSYKVEGDTLTLTGTNQDNNNFSLVFTRVD